MKTSGTAALVLVLLAGAARAQWASPRGEVTFPDKTRVTVEIADTDALRQRGLMFRERLGPNEGMVFVFPDPGYHPFWMKNTLIPLDMIWLDPGRKVIYVAHSVPPCKADPCPNFGPPPDSPAAAYVVEVQSGFAKQHAVKAGDQLVLKGIGPSRD